MIRLVEPGYWEGRYVLIRDDGRLSPTAKTRQYVVTSRSGNDLLGYVRWYARWRKYAFLSHETYLEEFCMEDLSQFIKDRTKEQREGWKPQSIVDWNKVKEYDKVTHVEG